MKKPKKPKRKVNNYMRKPPAFLRNRKHEGKGASTALSDRAFWLSPAELRNGLVYTLEAIDRRGDKGPLLALLRSEDLTLSREERIHLADMIDRKVGKPTGRPRQPSYERTNIEAIFELGIQHVQELLEENKMLVKKKMFKVKDAISIAAEKVGLSEDGAEQLALIYRGGRPDLRRKAKRRPR